MYKKFLPTKTNKQTNKGIYWETVIQFYEKSKKLVIFSFEIQIFYLNFYSEKYKKGLNTFKLQRDDNKFSFSIDIFVTFWVAHMLLASHRRKKKSQDK